MLKSLVTSMLVMGMFNQGVPSITAEVDRTEDNDMAVTLVYVDRGYREDYYQFDIPQEDYNERKADGEDLKVDVAIGKFYGGFKAYDYLGNEHTYYQFRSNDNEVWWALTEEDMGFNPDMNNEYILAYYDNGTTKENKPCDCAEEEECECELYDDIFLGVYDL